MPVWADVIAGILLAVFAWIGGDRYRNRRNNRK